MTIQPPMMSSNYTMTRTQRWRPEFRTAPTDLEGIPFSNSGYDPRRDPDRAAKMLKQVKDNVRQLLNHPWNKRQVKWDDKEWKMLEDNSQGYDTQSLMISCGTVTIDRAASGDRRVLLIWNKNTMAWQLPKGRKNVHEDFAAAALRETTEETGVAVQPLYLRFSTRLTLPDEEEDVAAKRLKEAPRRSIDNGIVNILSRDIFYISQYPDPATKAMRHIYWYVAKPQGSTTPDIGLMGRDDIRRMTVRWFSAAEAVQKLKMKVERDAVALAVHYAEQMSEEEWNYSREL